jgi:hypothetical protein
LEYNTILWEEYNGEIIGVCRFNLSSDTCFCLDVVIRPDFRKKRLLKLFLIKGIRRFPHIKYLFYERGLKDGKQRRYEIMKVIKVR